MGHGGLICVMRDQILPRQENIGIHLVRDFIKLCTLQFSFCPVVFKYYTSLQPIAKLGVRRLTTVSYRKQTVMVVSE